MLDVGVIGVGAMGKNHARVYSELKNVNKVFIFDLNEKAAWNIFTTTESHVCSSVEELLENVDAVSICVPTKYHYDVAQKVIETNTPFLVEKPICESIADAKKLIDVTSDRLICGVGQIERFNPIVKEIKKIIDSPIYIESKRHNPASARTNGSVVLDLMIHDIDVVYDLLDWESMESICSAGDENVCGALLDFNSTTVYLSASRKASKKIRSIYIEQEDCTIEGDYMTQEITIYSKPERYNIDNNKYIREGIVEKVMVPKLEPLKEELLTFLNCVETGKPFPVTLEQGLRNLNIAHKIENGVN
ncbi:MAG: Gfo/Idh/MocA family oxidoreductase [Tissierellia bacterium]|nr:Gfo/Idh/MocA family oxidoreductase [Tissierellia bacterium]